MRVPLCPCCPCPYPFLKDSMDIQRDMALRHSHHKPPATTSAVAVGEHAAGVQPYADTLVSMLLMSLPWADDTLVRGSGEAMTQLLDLVGQYMEARPSRSCPALAPFLESGGEEDLAAQSDSGAATFLPQVIDTCCRTAPSKFRGVRPISSVGVLAWVVRRACSGRLGHQRDNAALPEAACSILYMTALSWAGGSNGSAKSHACIA